jgi:hypothetical protein
MHIVQRSQGDLDLFRLKGELDAGSVEQLAFILGAMPGGRRIQFDFRQVRNAAGPEAAGWLKTVLARRPAGRGLLFSGIPQPAARRHARAGLPPAIFV